MPSDYDDLPLPAAEAVRAWWTRARAVFPSSERMLAGEVWREARVLDLLERGPCHRRATLVWWLEVLSGGRMGLDTRAWAASQRLRLVELRRDRREDLRARPWG